MEKEKNKWNEEDMKKFEKLKKRLNNLKRESILRGKNRIMEREIRNKIEERGGLRGTRTLSCRIDNDIFYLFSKIADKKEITKSFLLQEIILSFLKKSGNKREGEKQK